MKRIARPLAEITYQDLLDNDATYQDLVDLLTSSAHHLTTRNEAMTKKRKNLEIKITRTTEHLLPTNVHGVVKGGPAPDGRAHGRGEVAFHGAAGWAYADGCMVDFTRNHVKFDTDLPAEIRTDEDLALAWPKGTTATDRQGDTWEVNERGVWMCGSEQAYLYLPFTNVTLPDNALEQIFAQGPTDEQVVDSAMADEETPQEERLVRIPVIASFEIAGESFGGGGWVEIDANDPKARTATALLAELRTMFDMIGKVTPQQLVGPLILEVERVLDA